jgi:hypothetical protein
MHNTDFTDIMGEQTSVKDGLYERGMRIYPNPAVDEINILAGEMIHSVRIHSLSGKILIDWRNVSSEQVAIPLEELDPGMYIMHIETASSLRSSRIMVR